MPPQGYVVLGALGWNFRRSRVGKTTICQFGRRHPVATAVVLLGFNAWIWPHVYGPILGRTR